MSGAPRTGHMLDASWLRALFAAIQFLTRIPVPGGTARDPALFAQDLRRGRVAFPLVGALIGAITALCLWLFLHVLPFPVAVVTALAVEAALTGAFHEDAVADFCDAFGGGWTKEDILRILKDSRVGSFGVMGLLLAVALRASGLMSMGDFETAATALVVSGALGRLLVVALMVIVPPVAGREGLSTHVGGEASPGVFAVAALLIAPVLVWAVVRDGVALGASLALLAVFALWFRAYLIARIGGATGDCLGFAAYTGIVATTLAFARVH